VDPGGSAIGLVTATRQRGDISQQRKARSDMHVVQTDQAPRGAQHGRERSGWLLAIAGLVLLVASAVMMAASA
jgi:hypothetical protein